MENFNAWIGKKEISKDFVNSRPIEMLKALLNEKNKEVVDLPHLSHWLYFLPIFNQDELSDDGHPRKGEFLPPIPFPKRMWAGGRLSFLIPIQINQHIRRESEITKVEFKQGKSGNMYFVTIKHRIYAEDQLAIIEEQDIVYRDASHPAQVSKNESVNTIDRSIIEPKPFSYKKRFPIDTPALFRFSALTFNSHKIHYDRPYAMQQEGYPGLVVHGPLLATLLVDHFQQEYPSKRITTFDFRAVSPVFDFDEFFVCGDIKAQDATLWIEKANGQIAMKSTITYSEM